MTFSNELKPPLEEAIEHYGVKGMRWGVRRSQAELDRAAGRTPRTQSGKARAAVRKVGGTPASGLGKKAAWNPVRTSREIKNARREVKKATDKMNSLEDAMDQAKTPAQKTKAKKAFDKAVAEFDRNHHRAVAAQITGGETAAIALGGTLLASPAFGITAALGANAASLALSQKVANRRSNVIEAEFMKDKSYADLEKASAEYLKKNK